MRRLTLIHRTMILLALVLLSYPTLGAQSEASTKLGGRDKQRLAIFKLTLQGDMGGIDAPTRSAAAIELLGMRHAAADAVVEESLRSDRADILRAIFMALADDPALHHVLVSQAFDRLPTIPTEASESLAILLARAASTTPGVIDQLQSRAANPDAQDDHRQAAIAVLGECRHTPVRAAAALIGLLQQPDIQSPPVISAATDALGRLTGLPPDNNVDVWIGWWSDNRDRPAERWLADMVQALSRRVAALEHNKADAAQQQQVLAERMLGVHRNLWPLLSAESQAQRLPALLNDNLSQLRHFGVERAGVLLRDGNATPETNAAVLARLDDPNAAVRLAVAQLLPELPQESVPAHVTDWLPRERDHAVAQSLLTYCATHPESPVDLESLAMHLAHASTCIAANEALWVRLDEPLDPDAATALQTSVAAAQLANPTAPLHHLAAMLGDDAALDIILPLLDDDEPAQRTRTAEALRRRGHLAPITQRASDPAIFPVVVRCLHTGLGLIDFTAIAALEPVEPHVELWKAALLDVATTTSLAERIQVDTTLATIEDFDPNARIALLIPSVAPDQHIDLRLAAAQRLVPLLGATGEDQALIALVHALPAEQRPVSLDDAAFVAALRSRQFDAAATMRSDPRPWVTAFEAMHQGRPELADMVRTEIVRRFNETLPDTLRARLGMASDPLMGDASDTPGS